MLTERAAREQSWAYMKGLQVLLEGKPEPDWFYHPVSGYHGPLEKIATYARIASMVEEHALTCIPEVADEVLLRNLEQDLERLEHELSHAEAFFHDRIEHLHRVRSEVYRCGDLLHKRSKGE